MDHIGPGYFATMGIPLLLGREIGVQDIEGAPRVAVVNESFAKRFFPQQDPVGKHVRDTFPGNPGEAEIVGVVGDSKANSLRDQNWGRIYFPYFNPMWEHTFASYEIRTFGDAASVSRALRKILEDAGPDLPPLKIETMPSLVDQSLGTDRFIMQLSSAFGILALLLAGIGLYGVMSYNVARRTHDIGVRMALGARPARILSDILRETLFLVVVGVSAGIPAAIAGIRLIKGLLFGIGSVDPPVLALAITTLTLVALLAGFLPARRATHVDPMVALRHE
jgi:predicted permease